MTLHLCSSLLALTLASGAAAAPCALGDALETVALERAVDGDTVELDDGRTVRLAGVAAPKPPLGETGPWPLGAAARQALEGAAAGKVMELRPAAPKPDRHGRIVAWLSPIEAADQAGIATDLLARGLLRLSADATGRGCGATLRSAESLAIGARLGLWSDPYYAIRDASDGTTLAADAGRFVVAEGRVASVRTSAGRAYVNFGARWRDALSLTLSEGTLKRLGGFKELRLEAGARVRARGVVELRSGPVIYVSEAAQVERLDGRAE